MSYINYIDVTIEEVSELTVDIDVIQNATPSGQEKSVVPSNEEQIVLPDAGHCLSKVTVAAIPENYGLITYNGHSYKLGVVNAQPESGFYYELPDRNYLTVELNVNM